MAGPFRRRPAFYPGSRNLRYNRRDARRAQGYHRRPPRRGRSYNLDLSKLRTLLLLHGAAPGIAVPPGDYVRRLAAFGAARRMRRVSLPAPGREPDPRSRRGAAAFGGFGGVRPADRDERLRAVGPNRYQ